MPTWKTVRYQLAHLSLHSLLIYLVFSPYPPLPLSLSSFPPSLPLAPLPPPPSPPSPLPTHTVEHSKALPLLSALVNTNKYSQAGVWLKYAECLQVLNDLEGAAMAFSNVLVLAPHHTETRCSRLNFEINQSEGQIFSNLIR